MVFLDGFRGVGHTLGAATHGRPLLSSLLCCAFSGGAYNLDNLSVANVWRVGQLMDNREAAAALRESIRVNGRAQAASDEEGDSEEEGGETPAPVKVINLVTRGKVQKQRKKRVALPATTLGCLLVRVRTRAPA